MRTQITIIPNNTDTLLIEFTYDVTDGSIESSMYPIHAWKVILSGDDVDSFVTEPLISLNDLDDENCEYVLYSKASDLYWNDSYWWKTLEETKETILELFQNKHR